MRNVVLINLAVVLVLLFLIEGFASYLRVGYRMITSKPIAERAHTEYDEQLGWINLPNVYIEDIYGPGLHLTTNSQRYRNTNEISFDIPDGKLRIICSGDSFTLGYGVNDDQTWCQLLTDMDDRLETVNMGQGGYGVDQAYLWFKRNDKKLQYDAHIFAFITGDFYRMEHDTFFGYGKPYLVIRDGTIFQENRPVSRRSYYAPRLTEALKLLPELNTVRLFRKVSEKLTQKEDHIFTENFYKGREDLVQMILADLQRINQEKQSLLVLVYLPTLYDYKDIARTKFWRNYLQAEAQDNEYFFVDLVAELQSLTRKPEELFSEKHGHYSVEGNKYVADILHKKLNEIFAISGKFP
jgi:hypothetical protein